MQNKDSMNKILHLKKVVPGMASQLLLTLTHHHHHHHHLTQPKRSHSHHQHITTHFAEGTEQTPGLPSKKQYKSLN